MNSIADATLIRAGESYAAANTPLFLLRRLHEDSEVAEIARTFKPEQILPVLKAVVATEPKTPAEAVRPYVLLVALWHQDKIGPLKEAATLEVPHADWYKYIAGVLVETFSPVQSTLIQAPGCTPSGNVSINQTTPAKHIIIATH